MGIPVQTVVLSQIVLLIVLIVSTHTHVFYEKAMLF